MSEELQTCITEQEWQEIENRLKCVGWRVRLNCDGYSIIIVRGRVSEMRDALVVFAGGREDLDFKWVKNDCEERTRFACPSKIFEYTKKSRENWKRLSPAAQRRILREKGPDFDINKRVASYTPFWTNWKTLKAHLAKNNKVIRLIRPEDRSQREGLEDRI